MQLHVINPNTSSAMSAKIDAAARAASGAAEITTLTNADGAASLESHFEEALAVPGLLTLVDEITRTGDSNGIIIACFGDPGVGAARELAKVPVMGIAEAAMRTAASVATRFSVVTTLARTLPMAEDILRRNGLDKQCARLRACEVEVSALEALEPSTYQQLLDECRQACQQDGIDALVLGCAGMADLNQRLEQSLGIPVIDGVAAAVQQLEGLARLGITPAKQGDRAYPPAKPLSGPYAHLARR